MDNKVKGQKTGTANETSKLTKEALEGWINEGMGLRKIAEKSGESIFRVKRALQTFNLKTKSMNAPINKISFGDMNIVFMAVQSEISDETKIAEVTGLPIDRVKAIVKRLKRDGELVEALTVAKKQDVKPRVVDNLVYTPQ